ncbi:MAG: flagellar hook-length control protein FliK [Lentisphaeraceae bacterium]|nr:flagellar hook-length control protein FliK [Lentisphaeraceae bacterium]
MNLSILSHNFGNQQNANYSKVDHSKDSLNRKSFESNPVHSNEPHQTEQKDFKEYLADDEKPLKQEVATQVQTSDVKQTEKKPVSKKDAVKEESKVKDESSENTEDAVVELDAEDVKKIEKTVRKLLLDSINISPEKFAQIQQSTKGDGEVPEVLSKLLKKVDKLVSLLKNIAGTQTSELTHGQVTKAVAVLQGLKKAISVGDVADIAEKLDEVLSGNDSKGLAALFDKENTVADDTGKLEKAVVNSAQVVSTEKSKAVVTKEVPSSKIVTEVKPEVQAKDVAVQSKSQPVQQEADADFKAVDLSAKSEKTKPVDVKTPVVEGQKKFAPAAMGEGKVKVADLQDKLPKAEMSDVQKNVMKSVKNMTVESKFHNADGKELLQSEAAKKNTNLNSQQATKGAQAPSLHAKNALEKEIDQQLSDNKSGTEDKSSAKEKSQPLNFLKKLKSIVNKNESSEIPVSEFSNKQVNVKNKLAFIEKMNGSNLAKQIVDKLDRFLKATNVKSTNLTLQTPGLGEMKVAAEVTGAKLSLNLSSLNQNVRAELISIRQELSEDLKALGFDDVDLGFDFGDGDESGKNPFEDQMEEKRQKDPVKLPGDYLADLAEISTWLQSFNAS